ncbi:hypothetical protein H9W90_01980 [Polaribacter pectinis]|uniref:Lipoprotein n=1 Tax=Polaribacter pectinis TaxID=2738844 RepID=A0A7G9LBB4_9FLAO|nr:hypothetical protein [Polaribacter pectinis]QNM85913.1 hypothetical protein H9W90_01980 [Polaribacter pectinis]
MKTKTFKIIFTLIITLFLSCSDNENLVEPIIEDTLPPITEIGANTFGCLINGKVFIPKDKTGYTPPGGGTPKGLKISSGDTNIVDYYAITARDYISHSLYIYIPTDRPEKRKYEFKLSPGVASTLEAPNFPHIFLIINNKKYISFDNSGSIEFNKVDFISEVCAGIFNTKLRNIDNQNDIVQITNGRFDLICTKPIGD